MIHHRRPHFLAVLGFAAAAALTLLAGCAGMRDRRVLIMNFENSVPGGEPAAPFSSSLAEMMTACLANSPRVALLDRQDLAYLLDRAKGEKALRWQTIGRRANADYVIVGSIARLDRNYLINARLLSVKTGEIVKGSSTTRYARREEDIYPAVQAIGHVLAYQIKYLAELYDQSGGRKGSPPAAEAVTAPAGGGDDAQ